MNFLENSRELLLVHRQMAPVSLTEPVNVMLTPQFYTLKKEQLPVKYAYQAKRLAPSLFEGLLEKEGSYEFFVYKEGEYWVFIAYDIEEITALLHSKGLGAGDVSKIFFAQQSVEKFTKPYPLNEQNVLVVMDETLVVAPKSALGYDQVSTLKINREFTPAKGVSLTDTSGSLFTFKQALSFSLIFLGFAILFLIQGSRYGGSSGSAQDELNFLYETHPSLQSKYTREGIVSKYRDIDQKERAKRDAVKFFSGMIFKGVTLTSLYIDQQRVKAYFACKDNKVAKRVGELAKKAHYKVTYVQGTHNLYLEGAL